MSNIEYIIVQAGGKGTRLQKLTRNKPKAIVSVNNKPIIFHLFKKFEKANYIICADYKKDVLSKYLSAFAGDTQYRVIDASNGSGTCAGLQESLKSIPQGTPFMLIWCDLVLSPTFDISNLDFGKNYIGLSQDFECRWSYNNGVMEEQPSTQNGIAGLFIFKDKSLLKDVPQSGEFVRWLSTTDIKFEVLGLSGGKEYGLYNVVKGVEQPKCRPFNSLSDCIIKQGIDEQGRKLAIRERNWYSVVAGYNFKNLPHIYNLDPLVMEKINGGPIYTYSNLPVEDKKEILNKIVNCLKELHNLGSIDAVKDSYDDNYIQKTISRVEPVKHLIPFANNKEIVINGKKCKNFLFYIDEIKAQMDKYYPKKFVFLHGDSTFSNILLDQDKRPVLIDPRGYFGKTELYGDVAYDWAKLYYSLYTNYDQFNLKNFDLTIKDNEVELAIPKSDWADLKDYYLSLIKDEVTLDQISLILALIWLSLTTYAWDDYDSVCGAFYQGLLVLNECKFLKEV